MNNKRKESEQIEGYRLLGVSSWLTPESYFFFFFLQMKDMALTLNYVVHHCKL